MTLWDTGSCIDMSNMFKTQNNADPDVSRWETGKVRGMLMWGGGILRGRCLKFRPLLNLNLE